MKTSESITSICKAINEMQKALKPALKENKNPQFKSKYSDINSVWETLREPLTTNGLLVLQDVTTTPDSVSVITRVLHTSAEWIEFGPLILPLLKRDAQGIGSAITYCKRYSLCAALGITAADEDDDANAACALNMAVNVPTTPKYTELAKLKPAMSPSEIEAVLARYEDAQGNFRKFITHRVNMCKTSFESEILDFEHWGSAAVDEFERWKNKQITDKSNAI